MKFKIILFLVLLTSNTYSQHAYSKAKEMIYDFDKNGSLDTAYCTIEKGELYSSIQVAIYFYDENKIIKECNSKKIIFDSSNSESFLKQIYLSTFQLEEEDNSILMVFHRDNINYVFNYVYDNYDFDLLFYAENDRKSDFHYFKQIDFRNKKIHITKTDPESKENTVNKFPYTKNSIPKLSDFEFGSVTWPSVK